MAALAAVAQAVRGVPRRPRGGHARGPRVARHVPLLPAEPPCSHARRLPLPVAMPPLRWAWPRPHPFPAAFSSAFAPTCAGRRPPAASSRPASSASACGARASSSASRSRSCCGCYERYGPVFSMRLMYAPVVFALGPEANHYMTVSAASNFRWRDGGMGDLIPLLGDGLLTTDGDYHRRARRIMLPAFHREQIAAATGRCPRRRSGPSSPGGPASASTCTPGPAGWRCAMAMRALFGFDPAAAPEMASSSSARSGTGGAQYAAQMLRGPGSPYRAMVRARAWLDAVIFAEIERRLASRRARLGPAQPPPGRDRRGRLAPVRSRSCATR